MRIYTRTGDDGTTARLYGGRVRKDSSPMQLNGAVDEAQAALGMARAEAEAGSELDDLLVRLERDLYVLMAEVATDPAHRDRLVPGSTLVTEPMIEELEARIDGILERFELPSDFVVPGANRASACLDLARTVVRRAERLAVAEPLEGSLVTRYLNRLSDLLWAMARWAEGDEHLLARQGGARRGRRPGVRRAGSDRSDPGEAGTEAAATNRAEDENEGTTS